MSLNSLRDSRYYVIYLSLIHDEVFEITHFFSLLLNNNLWFQSVENILINLSNGILVDIFPT